MSTTQSVSVVNAASATEAVRYTCSIKIDDMNIIQHLTQLLDIKNNTSVPQGVSGPSHVN